MAEVSGEIIGGLLQEQLTGPVIADGPSLLHSTMDTDVDLPPIASTEHTGGDVLDYRGFDWGGHVQSDVVDEPVHGVIRAGTVTAFTQYTMYVYNAGDTARTLNAITTIVGGQGVSFTGQSFPVALPPRTGKTFTVEVTLDGPTSLESEFTLDLESGTDSLFLITGERLVARVWPLKPDWTDPVIEALQFRTDLQRAKGGSEFRRQMYKNPRQELEWRVLTDKAWLVDRLLTGWQSELWLVPRWQDESKLTSAASAGTTTLNLDTSAGDWRVGESVVLLASYDKSEAPVIDTVNPTSIELESPIQLDFDEGTPVYPGRYMRMPLNLEVERFTDTIAALTVPMVADEFTNSSVTADGSTLMTETFHLSQTGPGNEEIFTKKPNWRETIGHTYETVGQRIDPGAGLVLSDVPDEVNAHQKAALYALTNRAEIDDFFQWVLSRKGRLNSFWVPTWSDDMTMVQSVDRGDSEIKIEPIDWTKWYSGWTNREYFVIVLKTGEWYVDKVVSASILAGVETITLDWAFDTGFHLPVGTINPDDVERMMWLEHVRLDIDRVEMAWLTDSLVEVQLVTRGVPV